MVIPISPQTNAAASSHAYLPRDAPIQSPNLTESPQISVGPKRPQGHLSSRTTMNASYTSNVTTPTTTPAPPPPPAGNNRLTSRRRSSTKIDRAEAKAQRERKKEEKARKEAQVKARKEQEAKERRMTPREYAAKLQEKFKDTLTSTPPEKLTLKGKSIFYASGDYNFAGQGTRLRMDVVRVCAVNVIVFIFPSPEPLVALDFYSIPNSSKVRCNAHLLRFMFLWM